MPGQDKHTLRAALAIASAAGVSGLALLALALRLHKYTANNAASLSTNKHISCLTVSTCQTLTQGIGAAGVGLLAAALVMLLARRRVAVWWEALAEDGRAMLRAAGRLWRGLLAEPATASSLLALTLIACAVRWLYIDQPMRFDESKNYILYASYPFHLALVASPYDPNNHPLHTLLVRVSSLLLGSQPWALRLPALLAGVACVPAVYLLARRLYGHAPALLASALVTASSALVGYSTNARGYTLVCLEFMLLFTLATYLHRSRNRAGWLAYSLLGALGLFTIPTMLYPLGVTALWLGLMTLAGQPRSQWPESLGRILGYTGLALCLAAVLYSPIVAACGLETLFANRYVQPLAWWDFKRLLLSGMREAAVLWHRDIPLPLTALLGAAAFTGLASRRISRYPVPAPAAAVLFMVPAVLIHHPVSFPRVWSFLLPVYFMLAAAGLCRLLGPLAARTGRYQKFFWTVLALTLGLGLSGQVARSKEVFLSNETGSCRDAEAVCTTLRGQLLAGDRLFNNWPGSWQLKYYFKLYGLPQQHLSLAPRAAQRVWVAVDQGPGKMSLEYVLQRNGLRTNEFEPPQLVQNYPETTLYLLSRRQSERSLAAR